MSKKPEEINEEVTNTVTDEKSELEALKKKLAEYEKKAATAEKKAAAEETKRKELEAAAIKDAKNSVLTTAELLRKEEKVKVTLFKDNDKYKDDVYVAVNGVSYQIQRGVEVEVPKSVYEVLQNSRKQDSDSEKRLAELQTMANNENLR